MVIKVKSPSQHSIWLQVRHRDHHANRPLAWKVQVRGCEECLVELIWWGHQEIVKAVCKEHYLNHPNLLPVYYPTRTRPTILGKRVTAGGFNACSRCIDLIFIGSELMFSEHRAS